MLIRKLEYLVFEKLIRPSTLPTQRTRSNLHRTSSVNCGLVAEDCFAHLSTSHMLQIPRIPINLKP